MIHFEDECCFICGSEKQLELHHIFGGANRRKADDDGLTVYLCSDCHRESRLSVHQSSEMAQLMHAIGELMWLNNHPGSTVSDFSRRYGRNYLRDYDPKREEEY